MLPFCYTRDYVLRAFGREEHPTFEEYEAFLESRCFPKSRDKMKLILKDLDLPFYDSVVFYRIYGSVQTLTIHTLK